MTIQEFRKKLEAHVEPLFNAAEVNKRVQQRIRRAICSTVGHDWRWVFYKGRRCHRCEWVEARP